jgi:hypothetical protein
MALPETVVVRRKDIMEHLGIGKDRFYALIKVGHIRQIWTDKRAKRPGAKPMYLREDVLKVEKLLKECV